MATAILHATAWLNLVVGVVLACFAAPRVFDAAIPMHVSLGPVLGALIGGVAGWALLKTIAQTAERVSEIVDRLNSEP